MRKYFYCLIYIILSVQAASGQSHGLEFSSHEVVPEKRTSLNLTPVDPVCLRNVAEISFDLMLRPNQETYFGYVMRLLTSDHQNIDLVYNQRLATFNFVVGEIIIGSFVIDSAQIFRSWNRFRFRFDEKKKEASFYYNDQLVSRGRLVLSPAPCCRVFFGTNSFEGYQTLDVPPMRIKDIRIKEDGQLRYYYPLSESAGTVAKDQVEQRTAQVKNPIWVKPRHQHWEQVAAFETTGAPSTAFDKKREILYIITTDSLYQLSLRNMTLSGKPYARSREILPAGNQSVYDHHHDKLYNFYIDERKVSTYDSLQRTWDSAFASTELTEYWQANKFLSPRDSSLYIVCGYGQLRYKNLVQRYHFPSRQWTVVPTRGDTLMPRYLAALGLNETNDTAFIMGGYGSNTGDQAVNPRYNYELTAYSIADSTFHLRYRLPEPTRQFCFANSLVIDSAAQEYYALIYPNNQFNSSLQLIRGSLHKPEYQLIGDSIPYSFYDIRSFADLFYAAVNQKLIAVTLYHSKDEISSVKVYTLDFPPNPAEPAAVTATGGRGYWFYLLAGIGLVAVLGVVWLARKRKPAKQATPLLFEEEEVKSPDTSAIYLFGQFEVFDREGHDITKQFTPLLKELFLLLLVHSMKDGKGIATEELYDILWNDKLPKDARNNFSVNIVKLKAILEKIGEFHIGRESGKWKLEALQEHIYIDYAQYIQLLNTPSINGLLSIVHRGAFLRTTHYEWLDPLKFDISVQVIDILLKYAAAADPHTEAELIVKITNAIFHFDNLNEEALLYKCKSLIHLGRHSMAKETYEKFAKEYRESYGQDFGKSFIGITQH
ncbi:galactose oxidase [Chitinophaga cymbidii]|uniref:DNA-binding transcriptional activator n=1 Tax=Chitinophaga cymbidii TaxID=1096750 RepID=A0A512RFT6_9BACT|nr:galactose oxidase [Chitinophaga cymbidii]GEP94561.1 hypothetical protein CCY01nite_08210 [Chitinophaga cymbidii]